MAHDVFISYSSEDKATADAVCARLEGRAIRCWIAPRDVQPGTNYGASIIDAIHACRVMVLVLSSHANASPHIPNEIERAVSHGVAVLPFRIEDVMPAKSLDLFIGSVHWLDALTPPLERHLDQLADSVNALLGRRVAPPVPPPLPPRPRSDAGVWKAAGAGAAVVAIGVLAWLFIGRGTDSANPIVGCWTWSANNIVEFRADGTMTTAGFTGQWRETGGRGYAFTWPEPVDTLTMAPDGSRLNGSNQYGVPVFATRVSGGSGLPGAWLWGGAAPVTIAPGGSVTLATLAGSWDRSGSTYRVTWPKIQDTVTMTPDGQRVTGNNNYNIAVTGTKRAGC